jgi:hypothetical protein
MPPGTPAMRDNYKNIVLLMAIRFLSRIPSVAEIAGLG